MKLVLFEIINCLVQKIGYYYGAPTSATECFEKNYIYSVSGTRGYISLNQQGCPRDPTLISHLEITAEFKNLFLTKI